MSGSTAKPDPQPAHLRGHLPVRFRLVWIIAACLTLGLGACVNLTDYENAQVLDTVPLDYVNQEQQLGQSLTVRRSPLTGIQLWLRLSDNAKDFDSQLVFRIFSGEQFENERYAGQISYQQIASNYPILITFPELAIPAGDTILLDLTASGSPVWVYGRAEDNYPAGQLFRDGEPVNADVAFRLTYAYNFQSGFEDLEDLFQLIGIFLIAALVLILPGWALLLLGGIGFRIDISRRIALATGLSLAILPLVMLWTSQLGIVWSKTGVVIVFLVLFVISGGREIQHRRAQPDRGIGQTAWMTRERLALVALGGIFLATLFVRFAMVRDLSGPAWVDPVHHALISRLIQTSGQIPATFWPYASTPSVNYHTGFHVTAAVFTWLTGLDNADSLFIFGQLLNAAAVCAAFLLARDLTGSRLAGLVAALVTGFATPMPAYYTSWGRYTHLTGILILPVGFVLVRSLYRREASQNTTDPIKSASETRQTGWAAILLAAIAVAGLFLVHTRVAIFLFGLLLADLLTTGLLTNWKKFRPWSHIRLTPLLIAMGTAALLALPTLYPVLTRLLPERTTEWSQVATIEPVQLSWRYITTGLGKLTLGIGLLGCLLAVFRRLRVALILFFWVGIMFVSANLVRLGLPFKLPVSNDSVLITLFLPTAVAVGVLFVEIFHLLDQLNWKAGRVLARVGFLALVILTIYLGSRSLIPIINPVTVYLRMGDRQAAEWITDNLPPDARFLINPAPWGYGVYVGADGGYWVSPLTGRETFPPTLLYAHGSRETISQINQAASGLFESIKDPQATAEFMRSHGLDYIFLGARGGPISASSLLHSESFEIIYHEEGVWIFRVNSPVSIND